MHVVGIGQCSLDILGRLPVYPCVDQKVELAELKCEGGGPVATALVTLSRLGVRTFFAGRVGDDDFGRKIRSGLESEKVQCDELMVDAGASSQVAFIAVDAEGRRTIFWNPGTARALQPSDVDPERIRSANALHLDGLQIDVSRHAAEIARKAGVPTILDGGTLRQGTFDLLPLIDHLVVSEKFAEQLMPGKSTEQKLSALLAYGAVAATVTCGSSGSWTREKGRETFHQPAFAVQSIDTTGCGDVFHGAYVFGLLQKWDPRRVIRFAAACAALKTRELGGRSAIPDVQTVTTFINNYKNNKKEYL